MYFKKMQEFPIIPLVNVENVYYIYYDSPSPGYYRAEKNGIYFKFSSDNKITTIDEHYFEVGISSNINHNSKYKVIYSYEKFEEIIKEQPDKNFYTIDYINNHNSNLSKFPPIPIIPTLRFS